MASTKKPTGIASLRDYQVILTPVLTEKSSGLGGNGGSGAVFKVNPVATKTEIRDAIERIFGVEVAAIRTSNYIGKIKRTNRSVGRRKKYKKAFVTLKEGYSLDLVEGL